MSERINPPIGVARVALGRADGFARFDGTVQSFLNSLAPLIAFPLAGAVIELFRADWLAALSLVLLTLVAQLAPPVLSHRLAVFWNCEDRWLHYATAYNWCYWAIPMVGAGLTVCFAMAVGAGLPSTLAAQAVLGCLGLYSLWLNWFVARHTLGLSAGKAAILVVLVNAGTAALAIGPALLG
ncbi:MAG: hypothetical protein RQ966_04375 [Acetobacteraceae bacterium]|nr:hypothetical protein [Acetobacteraceae bacterium]